MIALTSHQIQTTAVLLLNLLIFWNGYLVGKSRGFEEGMKLCAIYRAMMNCYTHLIPAMLMVLKATTWDSRQRIAFAAISLCRSKLAALAAEEGISTGIEDSNSPASGPTGCNGWWSDWRWAGRGRMP